MRVLGRLLLLLLLVVLAVGGWLWSEYQRFLKEPAVDASSTVRIQIAPGQSFNEVVRSLPIRQGLQGARLFEFHARRTGKAVRVKAGEYDLEPQWTPEQVLDHLVAGKVVQHSLTLYEGHTFRQMMAEVRANDVLLGTLEGVSEDEVMEKLGFIGVHPEGRFLPDTYHFPRGTTDIEFLRRAYRDMERYALDSWANRDAALPLRSVDEMLTLASIIEKETGLDSEREKIAGVFIRRLRRGMRLETDPTVIYGIGPSFDGNLRRADLRRDTPYNTYTRAGLPPTPIAMPGRRAIHAALHPDSGKAVFFVSKGDGSHHFSETYAEHQRAVRKYQLSQKRQKGSQ